MSALARMADALSDDISLLSQ